MKIKLDHVTNSSSTSYVVFGWKVNTGKNWASEQDDYYNEEELEKQLAKEFNLPDELRVFDLHYKKALVGIVLSGYESVEAIPISEVLDKIDKLKEIGKKNGWKSEPKVFGGTRYSE